MPTHARRGHKKAEDSSMHTGTLDQERLAREDDDVDRRRKQREDPHDDCHEKGSRPGDSKPVRVTSWRARTSWICCVASSIGPAVRHGSVEVGEGVFPDPVRPTARYFTVELSTRFGVQSPRRDGDRRAGPRSKPSSSTWTIMRPFKT